MSLQERAAKAAKRVQDAVSTKAKWENGGPELKVRLMAAIEESIAELQAIRAELWPWPQWPEDSN